MEGFVKGEVVVVNFPFTDLSGFSKRPALVIANLKGDDIILCQITTQESRKDEYALTLEGEDFYEGKLIYSSFIRLNKLFTASKKVLLKKVGKINEDKLLSVETKLIEILKNK